MALLFAIPLVFGGLWFAATLTHTGLFGGILMVVAGGALLKIHDASRDNPP